MQELVFLFEMDGLIGGMAISVVSLINELSKNPNYKIVVISPLNSAISNYSFEGKVLNLTTKSSNWGLSNKRLTLLLKTSYEISQLLTNSVSRNAFIITNNVGASVMNSLVNLFAKYREIYVNRGGKFDSNSPVTRLMRFKLHHKKFSHIVATSQNQKKVITSFKYPEKNVTVIPNGLDQPKIEYIFKPLNPKKITIGSIGFISDIKNYIEGVRLVAILNEVGINATLNIYGSVSSASDAEYDTLLRREIKNLKAEEFVKFKGYVAGEEKFTECDIIISFSKTEGFGRTLVEAMLRNKPIIAWRGAGGPIDITNNGEAGYLVNENKAAEYAKIIQEMLSNPIQLGKMVSKAYEYASSNFTTDKMISNYQNFFNSLPKC